MTLDTGYIIAAAVTILSPLVGFFYFMMEGRADFAYASLLILFSVSAILSWKLAVLARNEYSCPCQKTSRKTSNQRD